MKQDTVARGIRLEVDPITGDVYIVFKVIDEDFKRRVKENFNEDIELIIRKK